MPIQVNQLLLLVTLMVLYLLLLNYLNQVLPFLEKSNVSLHLLLHSLVLVIYLMFSYMDIKISTKKSILVLLMYSTFTSICLLKI